MEPITIGNARFCFEPLEAKVKISVGTKAGGTRLCRGYVTRWDKAQLFCFQPGTTLTVLGYDNRKYNVRGGEWCIVEYTTGAPLYASTQLTRSLAINTLTSALVRLLLTPEAPLLAVKKYKQQNDPKEHVAVWRTLRLLCST